VTEHRRRVVFDVNVLVGAVAGGNSAFRSWPSPPPRSDNEFADCLGIVNDAREYALFLSPHILRNVLRVLTAKNGFRWSLDRAEEYADLLVEIVEASGGDVLEPEERVSDCKDFEDNRILELALAADADVIVSHDKHLTELSPWRGTPILTPRAFANRVDASRRAARRRGAKRSS
jgi:putative PIN family toxin of toxin-antitoxin system